MQTEVSSETRERAVVIHIDGDLTTSSSPEVQSEIDEILGELAANVILNLEKVNFVASTGLRVILALGKRLSSAGYALVVCSMNGTTRSVFDVSGFSRLFPVFDTEQDALDSL